MSTFPNESSEYRAARNALLKREVALRKEMESVAEQRRALPPGPVVSDDYLFDAWDDDGNLIKVRLSELFRQGSDTLFFYHYMFPRNSEDDRPRMAGSSVAECRERRGRARPAPCLEQGIATCTRTFATVTEAPIERVMAFAAEPGDWRKCWFPREVKRERRGYAERSADHDRVPPRRTGRPLPRAT